MAEQIPLNIPRELVDGINAHLAQVGGLSGFFKNLDEDAYVGIAIFRRRPLNRLLLRLIEDRDARGRILAGLSDDDRAMLSEFFRYFDLWRDLNPDRYPWVVGRLSDEAYELLRGPVPTRANDVLEAQSVIYLDSQTETYQVKTALLLAWPDKTTGGDRLFVIASRLNAFLLTLSLIVSSLRLDDGEIEVLRTPGDRDHHARLDKALTDLEEGIRTLRSQLGRLKS